jgi:3-isopropylmalate/(R)-2-methylmalate dehydratase small subunit
MGVQELAVEPIRKHRGVVAPLHRENIDTDQIIPKQHLKRIERTGFGEFLFFDWRYHPDGREREDFVLNHEHFRNATILVAGKNFGCGSSREHAAWALGEFGFRVILAPSFADIFRNNAGNNGLLVSELAEDVIRRIAEHADKHRPYHLSVDLEQQTITDDFGLSESFEVEPFRRHRLLHGLDEIGMTLVHEADIARFEEQRKSRAAQS